MSHVPSLYFSHNVHANNNVIQCESIIINHLNYLPLLRSMYPQWAHFVINHFIHTPAYFLYLIWISPNHQLDSIYCIHNIALIVYFCLFFSLIIIRVAVFTHLQQKSVENSVSVLIQCWHHANNATNKMILWSKTSQLIVILRT